MEVGVVLLPHCGGLRGRGLSARVVSGEAEECSVPKQVDPISFKNSQECARGGAGCLAPCHPLNYGSRTPALLAGAVPPGPTATPARGPSAWERPPGSRAGPGGCHCRPGAPGGWRSCGRGLARCPSADGNRARCYRQQRGRRRRGCRRPGAGGAAGAGVNSPSPPWRAPAWLLPQLCQPRAGDGRGFSTAACRLLPRASVSLGAGCGGKLPLCLMFRGHAAPAPPQVSLHSSGCPWRRRGLIGPRVNSLVRMEDPWDTRASHCAVGEIPLQGLGRARLWECVTWGPCPVRPPRTPHPRLTVTPRSERHCPSHCPSPCRQAGVALT